MQVYSTFLIKPKNGTHSTKVKCINLQNTQMTCVYVMIEFIRRSGGYRNIWLINSASLQSHNNG